MEIVKCISCNAIDKPMRVIKKGTNAYICQDCLIKYYYGQKELNKKSKA